MTDAEVVATFMEPRPPAGTHPQNVSEVGWWKSVYAPPLWRWFPADDKYDSLDAIWEVEERLSFAQNLEYDDRLDALEAYSWHATAEERIKALAAILRPIVEAA